MPRTQLVCHASSIRDDHTRFEVQCSSAEIIGRQESPGEYISAITSVCGSRSRVGYYFFTVGQGVVAGLAALFGQGHGESEVALR
jgi:hypothetical protein